MDADGFPPLWKLGHGGWREVARRRRAAECLTIPAAPKVQVTARSEVIGAVESAATSGAANGR